MQHAFSLSASNPLISHGNVIPVLPTFSSEQADLRDILDVLTVDANGAIVNVVEPQEQIDQHGFFRTRQTTSPTFFPARVVGIIQRMAIEF